jgi:hypothetical protein
LTKPEKSEAIACARSCRSLGSQGGGPEKNNQKKWRAEEVERHNRSLTQQKNLGKTKHTTKSGLPALFSYWT